MLARYHRALVTTSLVAAALSAEALPAMLELRVDGKVKIKGGELNGARAIIVVDDAGTVNLDQGLAHFTYALRLQTQYLFSFEKEGYVTKQVLFDTHVPVMYLAMAPFEFPFQVTLELPPTGSTAEYVGPVGFVRFIQEREDFGYDTDYTMKIKERMFERVREFRIAEMNLRQALATVSSPSQLPAPVEELPVPARSMEVHGSEPLVLDVLTPMVVSENARPAMIPVKAAVAALLPAPPPSPAPTPAPVNRPVAAALSVRSSAKPAPAPRQAEIPATTAIAMERTMTPIRSDMREEKLIVEPTRVTTVIHIVQDGEQIEYRRVAHRFGPVFFFRNGQSCTARQFEVETDRPAMATATLSEGARQ